LGRERLARARATLINAAGFAATVELGKYSAHTAGSLKTERKPMSARGFIPIFFSDKNIYKGTRTAGLLDVSACASVNGEKRITIHRLIFSEDKTSLSKTLDNPHAIFPEFIPKQASPLPMMLALLALGAGGILMRRNRSHGKNP
ncbi:MAG: hypothetical protein NWR03_06200, partial [Akkermansiaceae bacterium]|nr:hypothetical protein [Akkermansiaceae bacterium]MDP4897348.1 hypothetical protein [Akkermansiaceae bacterium]MDP4995762.1 hypothetical protein [Akkermansiaceae bacterium]